MRLTVTALFALTCLTGCFEPEVACPAIYIPSTIDIEMDAGPAGWPQEELTIDLDAAACTLTLPSSENRINCFEEGDQAAIELTLSDDGTQIELVRLMEYTPTVLDIYIATADDSLVLFNDSVEPSYVVI